MSKKTIIQIQTGREEVGGIANYISLLISSENLNNFQNIVLVKSINNGIKEKYFGAKFEKFNNKITLFNFLKRIFSLKSISKKYNNPLFHSHALKSGILVSFLRLFFNKKFVHTNHGLRFTQKKRNLFLIFFLLEILVIVLSEKYICIRKTDYNFLRSRIKLKFILKKIELIMLCLDKNSESEKYVYLDKFKDPFNLIAIGSLIEIKRPKKFISLIDLLVKNGLQINGFWLGGGPLMEEMVELTNKLSLNILWKGEVDKDQVFHYLNNSTYLVQTSEFEVYPTVVLESLSCGTPVISSKYWGVEELIKDGRNGIILKECFFIKGEKGIIDFLFNKKNYKKMSNFCIKDFYENHANHNNTSKEYKRIYEEIFNF